MSRKLREYGLGDSTPFVKGRPKVVGAGPDTDCPNCKCETLYLIQVEVDHPMLRGGKGIGSYIGCPACPWASPMIMAAMGATGTKTGGGEEEEGGKEGGAEGGDENKTE